MAAASTLDRGGSGERERDECPAQAWERVRRAAPRARPAAVRAASTRPACDRDGAAGERRERRTRAPRWPARTPRRRRTRSPTPSGAGRARPARCPGSPQPSPRSRARRRARDAGRRTPRGGCPDLGVDQGPAWRPAGRARSRRRHHHGDPGQEVAGGRVEQQPAEGGADDERGHLDGDQQVGGRAASVAGDAGHRGDHGRVGRGGDRDGQRAADHGQPGVVGDHGDGGRGQQDAAGDAGSAARSGRGASRRPAGRSARRRRRRAASGRCRRGPAATGRRCCAATSTSSSGQGSETASAPIAWETITRRVGPSKCCIAGLSRP